jgi:hypothetical protein
VLRIGGEDEPGLDFAAIEGPSDSLRLWISDRQWLAMLRRIEQGEHGGFAGGGSDATGERNHARVAADFRCMIRLGSPDRPNDDHGVYTVRTRNIGAGGLGFVHGRELHAGTRCTVALEPVEGPGVVIAGKVAWCRPVDIGPEDPHHYEVGVQFDRPIDMSGFERTAA